MASREVVIRRSLPTRIFTTVFGLVWTAGLATVSVVMAQDGAPFPIGYVPITMATFGGILFWRQATASVKTGERAVRVRNVLRTVEVPWTDIEDIGMVQVGGEARDAVRLLLRNGRTVAMDVLDGDSESGSLRGMRQRIALDELRARHQRVA